ncbi:MAG: metallophosphoesterase [Nitrospirae bacterium]|nr:metallophosphoesterase [Nitrospirota bacterium]MBF0534778.1 metallophosphoesterase [Nitrospirota bacterium]MBF0616452.1 metallophosphoesterase [Nitrospirota bacterium]
MKKSFRVFLVVLALLFPFSSAVYSEDCSSVKQPFSFIVFGDSRADRKIDAAVSPSLAPLVVTIKAYIDNPQKYYKNGIKPSFIMFNGDLAVRANKENYATWKKIMQPLYDEKLPIAIALGNHELYDSDSESGYLQKQKDFQDFNNEGLSKFPEQGRCIKGWNNNAAYSFMWNNSLFITMDTYLFPHELNEHKKYDLSGWMDKEQLNFVKHELVSNNKATFTFVFAHTPIFTVYNSYHPLTKGQAVFGGTYNESLQKLWQTLDNTDGDKAYHHIDAYFSGHDHFYARKLINKEMDSKWKNSIVEVVCGGAGAPLANSKGCLTDSEKCITFDTPPEISSQFHFVVVNVYDMFVTLHVFNTEGAEIDHYLIEKVD